MRRRRDPLGELEELVEMIETELLTMVLTLDVFFMTWLEIQMLPETFLGDAR